MEHAAKAEPSLVGSKPVDAGDAASYHPDDDTPAHDADPRLDADLPDGPEGEGAPPEEHAQDPDHPDLQQVEQHVEAEVHPDERPQDVEHIPSQEGDEQVLVDDEVAQSEAHAEHDGVPQEGVVHEDDAQQDDVEQQEHIAAAGETTQQEHVVPEDEIPAEHEAAQQEAATHDATAPEHEYQRADAQEPGGYQDVDLDRDHVAEQPPLQEQESMAVQDDAEENATEHDHVVHQEQQPGPHEHMEHEHVVHEHVVDHSVDQQVVREEVTEEQMATEQDAEDRATQEHVAEEEVPVGDVVEGQIAEEQVAEEHASGEHVAQEQAVQEQADQEQVIQDQAAQDQSVPEHAPREHAEAQHMQEQVAHEQAAQEHAAQEDGTEEQGAQEQDPHVQVTEEHAAHEHAARQHVAEQELEAHEELEAARDGHHHHEQTVTIVETPQGAGHPQTQGHIPQQEHAPHEGDVVQREHPPHEHVVHQEQEVQQEHAPHQGRAVHQEGDPEEVTTAQGEHVAHHEQASVQIDAPQTGAQDLLRFHRPDGVQAASEEQARHSAVQATSEAMHGQHHEAAVAIAAAAAHANHLGASTIQQQDAVRYVPPSVRETLRPDQLTGNGPARRIPERYHPSAEQLKYLLQAFEEAPTPSAGTLTHLSNTIGMPMHNLVLWFKNRRARQKKKYPAAQQKSGKRSYVRSGVYSRNPPKRKSAERAEVTPPSGILLTAQPETNSHPMQVTVSIDPQTMEEVHPKLEEAAEPHGDESGLKRSLPEGENAEKPSAKRRRFPGITEVVGEDNPCREWDGQECYKRCIDFFVQSTRDSQPEQTKCARSVANKFFLLETQTGLTLTSAMQPLETSVDVLDRIIDSIADEEQTLNSGSRIILYEFLAQIRSGKAASLSVVDEPPIQEPPTQDAEEGVVQVTAAAAE